MPWNRNSILNVISFLFIIAIVSIPNIVFSQVTLKGKVIYRNDAAPAAASIGLLNRKNIETMTNFAGNFSLHIANSKSNDTVVISSVGYQSIRLPVSIALKKSEFILSEIVKNLESVTVFNTAVLGSTAETVGYFRSWNSKNTGGEIGRTFRLPYKKYKIDKVRFKVANFCDTCLLRLHIREVIDNMPGEEIVDDSISVTINKLMLNGKVPEFDLTPYDLSFTEDELYVSIEVINCGTKPNESCSFSFAGTEKGAYIYKSTPESEWQVTDDYTVYLRVFIRY